MLISICGHCGKNLKGYYDTKRVCDHCESDKPLTKLFYSERNVVLELCSICLPAMLRKHPDGEIII